MSRLRLESILRNLLALHPQDEIFRQSLVFHQISNRGHLHLSERCRGIKKNSVKIELNLKDILLRHVCVNCSYNLGEQNEDLATIFSVAQDFFSSEHSGYREAKLLEKDVLSSAKELVNWEQSYERFIFELSEIPIAQTFRNHIVKKKANFTGSVKNNISKISNAAEIKKFAIGSLLLERARISNLKHANNGVEIGENFSKLKTTDKDLLESIIKIWLANSNDGFTIEQCAKQLIESNPLTKVEQLSGLQNVNKISDEKLIDYLNRVYFLEVKELVSDIFIEISNYFHMESKKDQTVLVVLDKKRSHYNLSNMGALIKFASKEIYQDKKYQIYLCQEVESKLLLEESKYDDSIMKIKKSQKISELVKIIPQALSLYEPHSRNLYANFTASYKAIVALNKN